MATIEVGMDEKDLVAALGRPASSLGTSKKKILRWPQVEAEISEGKVTRLQMKEHRPPGPVGDVEEEMMILCALHALQMSGKLSLTSYEAMVTQFEKAMVGREGKFANRAFEGALHNHLRAVRLGRRIWREFAASTPTIYTTRYQGEPIRYVAARRVDPEVFKFLKSIPEDTDGLAIHQDFCFLTRIDPVINHLAEDGFARLLQVYKENSPKKELPDDVAKAAKRVRGTL